MSTRTLKIVNEKGLHARASAKFVEVVERFDARAQVRREPREGDGRAHEGVQVGGRVAPEAVQARGAGEGLDQRLRLGLVEGGQRVADRV